ncbi:MAG: CHAT domain-containing tetratricopeptide repeat protein [Cytophagales bacterium]|nr:CHAT domain-containing tetratricopeptide repeat protein [Cytophagales bacterium]
MIRMIFVLGILTFACPTYAQFGKKLKKFGEKVQQRLDQEVNALSDDSDESEASSDSTNGTFVGNRIAELNELQAKQLRKDTSYYNYTLAQAEKVAFFDSRDDEQNLVLAASKGYREYLTKDAKPLRHEKAFDFNRIGSKVLTVNKSAALLNFNLALKTYIDPKQLKTFFSNNENEDIGSLLPATLNDSLTIADRYALCKTFMNLGIYYHSRGQYLHAEQLNRAILPFIAENLGSTSLAMASTYNNLALIERDLGNYGEAEEYLERSIALIQGRRNEEKLDRAVIQNNQAMLYQEIGQYDRALETMDDALALAEQHIKKKGDDYSKLQINKALIYKSQRQFDAAESLLLELKKTKEMRLGKRHQDYADIESLLAAVYMGQGKTEQVESLLTHALDIYKNKFSVSHPAYTSTLRLLAQFYFLNDSYEQAWIKSKEVFNLVATNFGEQHPDYQRIQEDLAVIAWNQNQMDSAFHYFHAANDLKLEQLNKFFPALSENEKSKLWAKLRPSFIKFYAFASEHGSSEAIEEMYNIQLAIKGILLSSTTKMRQEILNSDDESLKNDYLEWTYLKEELANYYTLSKQDLAEQGINLDSIEGVANALEKRMSLNSQAFAEASKLTSMNVATLTSTLGNDEAAVEIIRFPAFKKQFSDEVKYAILVLDKEGIKHIVLENGVAMESKLASLYRRSIEFKVADNRSYSNFWKPVAPLVTDKKTIYLSMDGIYNQINLNTLLLPDGSYLGDEMLLISVSSTRDIEKVNKTSKLNDKLLMFGFPDYGGTGKVAALPGTKAELEEINKIARTKGVKTEQYLQAQANEAKFKSATDDPGVLHIATHGFFLDDLPENDEVVYGVEISKAKENPLLRSGLMLADAENTITNAKEVSNANNGILTAYEAMTLDLDETKMVVLSACETGLGEIQAGEGVYGLQRAFQIAGAETIIMSLWKVNDEATQKLMTRFYDEWLTTGDKFAAFKSAQLAIREQYEEPYYWGAFVMLN